MTRNYDFSGAVSVRSLLMGLLVTFLWLNPAAAQTTTTYTVDPDRSLAWWQIDPHFGHLWASTCPNDPSWQPGEGHSPGYYINYATRPKIKTTKTTEKKIPLFPRRTVRPNCRHAMSGSVTTTDPSTLQDVKGVIKMTSDSLETGADHRNLFSRKYVFQGAQYPTVNFIIDSISGVTTAGDTVSAVAIGIFQFRGVKKATRVQITSVKTAQGLRVRGTFAMPAAELEHNFGVSKVAMGGGVGLSLWDTLFMGFDLIMVPAGVPPGT